uniref:Uncharacterized protein n=2 Tax=Kalmanozyma brasiliensis (strain GHG001) TaxID=1365824 RepID=V5EB76_KALBG
MLPKINTDLSAEQDTSVPQMSLENDTPRASAFGDRDQVLKRAASSRRQDSKLGGRSMDTVREDASEDDGMDGRTPTHDVGGLAEASISPKKVVDAVSDAIEAASLSSTSCKPSPSRVVFRDPFQGALPPSSKPTVRADIVDDESPETQVTFTARGKPKLKTSSKRSSLSGFRSIFRGRSQTQ